jgi:hypothetical protein
VRARVITLALVVAACSESSCPMPGVDPKTGVELPPPPPDPRWCDLGFMPAPDEIAIAPASSCASGACLHVPLEHDAPRCSNFPDGAKGLCTAACQADADCAGLDGPCVTGYTCGVAMTVGPYCCERVCMCKDFVEVSSTTPAPCDPANTANACCNLPGRSACTP